MLAFEGYVTPSQADRIRPLMMQRNRLAHGELSIRPASVEMAAFISIIGQVHQLVQAPEAA
jgi:hypothetical protein